MRYAINFPATCEQVLYANKLVADSFQLHTTSNYWDKQRPEKTQKARFTGAICEIAFADIHQLKRPTKTFGAVDGQDNGIDFILPNNGLKIDVKAMQRNTLFLRNDFAFNLCALQAFRPTIQTEQYYCMSVCILAGGQTVLQLVGNIGFDEAKAVGIIRPAGIKIQTSKTTAFAPTSPILEVSIGKLQNINPASILIQQGYWITEIK